MGMPIRLQGWTQAAIDKARMFELITNFGAMAATRYPELMAHITPCINRLQPVRLSPGGRSLRCWGREYRFTAEEAPLISKIVKAFKNGARCVTLGEGVLLDHKAVIEGVIQRQGGTYWLEEPLDEKAKPKLVLFVEAEPEEVLSKKMRALAILAEHPEWSDTRIAKAVPCARQVLYTWDEFVTARKALAGGRQKYQRDCTEDEELDLD